MARTTIVTESALGDQLTGLSLLAVAVVVYVYYTTWVFVTVRRRRFPFASPFASPFLSMLTPVVLWPRRQPFFEATHWVQAYFPDRFYALAIPAGLMAALVVFVGVFVACVLARNKKKKASKPKAA